MTADAIDLRAKVAHVVGKGRRPRTVAFGVKIARALDRYLRTRVRHQDADAEAFWLGQRGPLSADGIRQALERRGKAANVEGLHPRRFRHTLARRRRQPGRSDGPNRLALPPNAHPLRRLHRRRACPRGTQAVLARRPHGVTL